MNRADGAKWLVDEATRYRKVRERPKGSNRGTEIDYWIRECGLDPAGAFPWCLAFVQQMGRQAVGRLWPCGRSARVQDVVDWAVPLNLLKDEPQPGDLLVLWYPARGVYAHIGIVAGVMAPNLRSIEGNTIAETDKGNPEQAREGYGVFERTDRRITPGVKFVRWTEALPA